MKLIIRIFATIILTILILQASAQNIYVPKGTIAGEPYGYVYNNPPGATKLLVSLHGTGQCGNGTTELYKVENEGVAKLIKAKRWTRTEFVTFSPQLSVGSSRFYGPTLHTAIIQQCKKFNIDTTEVYLMGISRGAISVYDYIIRLYSVKAAVCIAGSGTPTKAHLATKTKLWCVHGEKDQIIPYTASVDFVNAYNRASPKYFAKLTLIPFFGHDVAVWDKTFQQSEIYEWMLNP
jgi:predicted peptidase